MNDLELARRRFAERVGELRGSLERETGRKPRSLGWTLLWVAAAAGFALAVGGRKLSRARRRKLESAE